MSITRTSHEHHISITWVSQEHHMNITSASHEYHMNITSASHEHHMRVGYIHIIYCHRSFRCAWRVDGEALLSQVLWRLHTQVLTPPPYWWCLLWHRVSPHAVHGTPRAPPTQTKQSVRTKVRGADDKRPETIIIILWSDKENRWGGEGEEGREGKREGNKVGEKGAKRGGEGMLACAYFNYSTHPSFILRLYGFKIHPEAYRMQQQAASRSRSANSRPRSQKQPYKWTHCVIIRVTHAYLGVLCLYIHLYEA